MAASYPTSVKVFTGRSNGQVIDASHVNDLQDEVNAIEDGIINGTAHLQSSNSTLTNLNVTGGSTLVNLQVTNSSFSVRPVTVPPNMAYVFRDAVQDFASSANSTILWIAENYVQNSSMHSTGTNPERLTPQSTGFYAFNAEVGLSSPSTSVMITLFLMDSSNAAIAGGTQFNSSVSGGGALTMQIAGFKRYDALGGFATLRVNAVHTSTLSASSGVGTTWGTMVKL